MKVKYGANGEDQLRYSNLGSHSYQAVMDCFPIPKNSSTIFSLKKKRSTSGSDQSCTRILTWENNIERLISKFYPGLSAFLEDSHLRWKDGNDCWDSMWWGCERQYGTTLKPKKILLTVYLKFQLSGEARFDNFIFTIRTITPQLVPILYPLMRKEKTTLFG
ncbi:hypothetical protein AVEN_155953-1 [Araneus ventricosus]|uniref:Uncharacterized protein n=1 Tax=Araneus ventricosus TaxID=182803 RepID=A0A4Y2GUS2_ARAVE|nr:hypothetical protein AVEN_155953-1 [Araneus ventricosus]